MLVFAYACEPGRGSEPGAGWGIVRALAQVAHCTVLVGPEHGPGIDRWAASAGEPNLCSSKWASPPGAATPSIIG